MHRSERESLKAQKKNNYNDPKIICPPCLNSNYVKRFSSSDVLGELDYLVITNNVQAMYRRNDDSASLEPSRLKLLNCSTSGKGKAVCATDQSCIVKKENGSFDIFKDNIIDGNDDEQVGSNAPYICRLCGRGFQQLPVHHSQHHKLISADQPVFPCVLCEFGYSSYDEVGTHMHQEHLLEEREEWLDEGTGILRTAAPGTGDEDSQLRIEAEDSDSGNYIWIVQADSDSQEEEQPAIRARKFQCLVCKRRYSSEERLARHDCGARSCGKKGKRNADSGNKYSCQSCSKVFPTKVRLQFHTRQLQCTLPLCCASCPELVPASEEELFDHVHFAHSRSRRHSCPHPGCARDFLLKASLTTHLRCHAGERAYECEKCGKKFLDRQTLTEHRVTHLEVKPFQCHICLKFLNRLSRLRMHLLTHDSEPVAARVLSCRYCQRVFRDAQQAEEHVAETGDCPDCEKGPDDPPAEAGLSSPAPEDQGALRRDCGIQEEDEIDLSELSSCAERCVKLVEIDKAYRCEYCEKAYWRAQSLDSHRIVHRGQTDPFSCHICSATFSSYSRCTTHKTTHGFYRSRHSTPVQDNFPVVRHFLCEVCSKSYLHWTYLQVHRRQKHSDNVHMYKCRTCGDEFPNSWGIAYHRKKVHGQQNGSAPTDEISLPPVEKFHYSCPDCGTILRTKAQLFLHRRAEHPPSSSTKPGMFSCANCHKRYTTIVGLRGHMKTHVEKIKGDVLHPCTRCSKTFVHATGLNTHIRRVHLRELNYRCELCAKAFYSASDLRSHTRRHTGERPYPCHACSRSFRTHGMRNEHLRIHTGERPFSCDTCGLAFRRPYALKSHRLIHSGLRSHACSLCARHFRLRAELNTHMRHTHAVEPNIYTPAAASEEPSPTSNTDGFSSPPTEIILYEDDQLVIADTTVQNARETDDRSKVLVYKSGLLQNDSEIFTAIFEDGPQIEFGNETIVEIQNIGTSDRAAEFDDVERFHDLFRHH